MNKGKILIILGVLAVVGAGIYFASGGGLFQGSIFNQSEDLQSEIDQLQIEIAEQTEVVNTRSNELEKSQKDAEKLQSEADTAKKKVDELTKKIKDAGGSTSSKLSRNKSKSTTDTSALQKELKTAQSNYDKKAKAAKDAWTLVNTKETEVVAAEEELQNMQARLVTLQTQLSEQQASTDSIPTTEGNPATGIPEGLSNIVVSSDNFAPASGETSDVSFNLNTYNADTQAYSYRLRVYTEDNAVLVKEITENADPYEVEYSAAWDGRNSFGKVVPDGQYILELAIGYAYSSNLNILSYEDARWGMVTVSQNGGGQSGILEEYSFANYSAPSNLATINVSNGTVDPTTGGKASFFVNLNRSARYFVNIFRYRADGYYGEENLVAAFVNDEFSVSSANYNFEWAGSGVAGAIVDDGQYTIQVIAQNDYDSVTVTGMLVVQRSPEVQEEAVAEENPNPAVIVEASPPVISGFGTFPPLKFTFDSDFEALNFSFYLSNADTYTVYVEDSTRTVVKVITLDAAASDGQYSSSWDGTGMGGYLLNPGEYTVWITARNAEMDEEDPPTIFTYNVTVRD